MTDKPSDISQHLALLLNMRSEVAALSALLNKELAQWHGLSLDDFLLVLVLFQMPDRQMERSALAEVVGERLVELVKRIRSLQRIGIVAENPTDIKDVRKLPVALTDGGAEIVKNAIITANDVATGALNAQWSHQRFHLLQEVFAGGQAQK